MKAKFGTIGWLFHWLFKWAEERDCRLFERARWIRVVAPPGHYIELNRYRCIDAHMKGRFRQRMVKRLDEWMVEVIAANKERV